MQIQESLYISGMLSPVISFANASLPRKNNLKGKILL